MGKEFMMRSRSCSEGTGGLRSWALASRCGRVSDPATPPTDRSPIRFVYSNDVHMCVAWKY